MIKIEGAVTEETILNQCILMSKNSKLDAFCFYFGSCDKLSVSVNYNADYVKENGQNCIYKSNSFENVNKTLTEIYQDLIAIEVECTEKQTALDEARFP